MLRCKGGALLLLLQWGILKFLFYRSVYVFHFGGISGLRQAFDPDIQSNAVKQPVSFGKFQSFEYSAASGVSVIKRVGLARQQEPMPIDQRGKYHILTQQSAVYLRAVYEVSFPMNTTVGGIAEHILEIGVFRCFRVLLLEDFTYPVQEFRIVYYAYRPGLFVLTVGGVDTALQDYLHRVPVHCFRFVLADAAAR